VDSGRSAILENTRMILPDLSASVRPFTYNSPDKLAEGGGFHHMHRQDLLMCLHQRARDFAPGTTSRCPIEIHMGRRLVEVEQNEGAVTAVFADGTRETGDVLVAADGIHSRVLRSVWPQTPHRRWTGALIFRGLIPRHKVAGLRRADGTPLAYNPIDGLYHDSYKRDEQLCMAYWVRGGELLNVAMTWHEPGSTEFTEDWSDWRPVDNTEMVASLSRGWDGDQRKDDVLALAGAMENTTKWGLYDRDAFPDWQKGRVCLLGDAAHPMLPTFGQGASQSFEDGAALAECFALHGTDVTSALLHYERVRHYRATRMQFGSKIAFKALEPQDSQERRMILAAVNERDMAIFDHEQRAGDDDSWIYEFDARRIGDTLPSQQWGPNDYRGQGIGAEVRRQIHRNLWKPPVPRSGDHPVTRDELEAHATFDDSWIKIGDAVYDFSEWKDHHPGGPFVAKLHAGKDATAEFDHFHSKAAMRHMRNFRVGPYVEPDETRQ